jgi:hypothetical protein
VSDVHQGIATGPLGRGDAIGLAVLLILLLSGTWLLSGLLVARADPFAVAAGRALASTAGRLRAGSRGQDHQGLSVPQVRSREITGIR